MKFKSKLISIIFCTALILGACSNGNNDGVNIDDGSTNGTIVEDQTTGLHDAPESEKLLDRMWSLSSYTRLDGSETSLIETTSYQFIAESGSGELRSSVNCNNSSGGSYSLSDGFIVLTFGFATEIACGLEGSEFLNQQMSLEDLLGGQGESNRDSRDLMVSFKGKNLVLTAPDARQLIFTEVNISGM